MPGDSDRYYVTTPIYYPNGEPHLGHVYTTLAADALARHARLAGRDAFFLTGTDEHGVKMVKTAATENTTPQALADANAAVFRATFEQLGVTNDDFIRTSSDRHKRGAAEIVRQLVAQDDVYLGSYEGWYDEGQEEFITETEAKAAEFKSRISGRPLVRYSEPTYFFRLTKYAPRVIEHIEANPGFVRPESRRNEVLSKLRIGVDDLSISRTSLTWGIPMPNDPAHVLYVWVDALSNYVTALGYPPASAPNFVKFWPADVHLIGKEILWFHAVYWPALLMALGLPLPRALFAHGWWTADGKKMSKTLGNFVDIEKLRGAIDTYGLDALRFYLFRAAPFGNDLDWSDAELARAHGELGNVVGNLLNRVLKMVGKYRAGKVPPVGTAGDEDAALVGATAALQGDVASAFENVELQRAVLLPVELCRAANSYVDQTKPFSLAKDAALSGRLDTVLNLSVQAVYRALVALLPTLPAKAAEGLRQLGVTVEATFAALPASLPAGHALGEGEPLFPRVETPV